MVRRALMLAVFVTALGAAPAHAAATLSLSHSADPTEDKSVVITTSGSTTTSRSLFVFIQAGSADCAATAFEEDNRSNASRLRYGWGVGSPSQSFTFSDTFTPATATAYRTCAYVASSASAAPDASATELFTVRRPTGTLAISFSGDPTEDTPVTVTTSGTTEVSRLLFVFAEQNGTTCASTAFEHDNRAGSVRLTYGYGYGYTTQDFSDQDSFIPSAATSYRICAYLSESTSAQPNATATQTFAARRPTGALTIAFSGDPTEDTPVTVTTSGTTEVSRSLFVFAEQSGTSCAATAFEHDNRAGSVRLTYGYGYGYTTQDFSDQDSLTPTEASAYRICAYLAETASAQPNATKSETFTARRPAATVATTASGEFGIGKTLTVTSAGTTEVSRSLFVFVQAGGNDCASTAFEHDNRANALRLTYGYGYGYITRSFTDQDTFTPAAGGTYRLCAYVAESASSQPNAVSTSTFVIPGVQTSAPRPTTPQGDDDDRRRTPLAAAALLKPDRDHSFGNEPAEFEWVAGEGSDRVYLYDDQPSGGATPIKDISVGAIAGDPDRYADRYEFEAASAPTGERRYKLRVLQELPPGRYWWTVTRETTEGLSSTSEARPFAIAARPLRSIAVRVKRTYGSSSKNPGHTRLTVASAALARLTLVVERGGRRVKKANWTEDEDEREEFIFRWSCASPGKYTFEVTGKDDYGNNKKRTGSWEVSGVRCAAMKRAEARKREAERRRRAARRRRGGRRGGGGGGGAPVGDRNCSDFSTQSQAQAWHNAHGGDLDGDGDGVACESLP
jgi:hypothetical protein